VTENQMYHGDYVDCLRDGYGIAMIRNGVKVKGEWKKGGVEGNGVYTFLDGSKMEGYHEKG